MGAQRRRWRRATARGAVVAAFAVLTLVPVGCSETWDHVLSRDFSFHDYFVPPDPLVVLRDDTDGDHRARALRRLQEPKQHGASDKDQDFMVQLLTTAAAQERIALCRLAAIETLETYKDRRVVKALEDAYYRAASFSDKPASIIRCRALEALGKVEQPEAIPVLVRVLRESPVSKEATEAERQQQTDERTAAARALGHYRGHAVAEALLDVMKPNEKNEAPDLALLDCAHVSLQASTGMDFGTDVKLWAEYLQNAGKDQPDGVALEKGIGGKLYDLVVPVSFR
jgi:HEAT repeat protein